MEESRDRIIEFERLNLLGKALFVSGAAARVTAGLLEKAVDRAADIVTDSERAFRQGRDANIDDAKVLEEHLRSGDDRLDRR